MIWTNERDEQLRTLWRSGLSALQVGQKLGATKNAILGRLHRLHEPKRAKHLLPPGPGRAGSERFGRGWRMKQPTQRIPAAPPELRPDNNPRPECNVSLFDAKPGQCREVVGYGDLFVATFCGAPTVLHSCCQHHAGINYTTPKYWTRKVIPIEDLTVAQQIQINVRRVAA